MAVPIKVWSGAEWLDIGVQGGTVLYQNEEPASPETGMIWIDADSETSVVDADTFLTQSTASATYAPSASPTFTGEVNLPSTTNYDGSLLSDTLASKLPYSYGTATPSTSDSGFLWYDSNSTPAEVKFWDGAAFQALTSGKILQIVRATDSTQRSTTSTSYVDVTGMSVTITPQKSDSALILIAQADIVNNTGGADARARFRITDSSNNPVSGAERMELGPGGNNFHQTPLFLAGYATPATTSSVTYKLRFLTRNSSNSVLVENDQNTGQMYAIEVSA